ncbi:MAG: phosphate ABC transporter permease subunit PstC [Fimbriimonadaceae bacterium]
MALAKAEKTRRAIIRRGFSWLSAKEKGVKGFTLLCAIVSVLTTVGIVVVLFTEAATFFQEVSVFDFLTGTEWSPAATNPQYGIWALLSGTLLVTIGSAMISVPLGLLSAVYLSEYAPQRIRKVVKPALEILAGIPTVVYGYFALFFVTPLLQVGFEDINTFNAAAGAIVVGIMTLPMVSSLCEDALSAVPRALREGAYGLGATKFEVTSKIVIPAALSGVVASFILALSRAIGETMAVTLAAGASPNFTFNPAESVQTMTAYIVTTSSGDVARGTIRYQTIFAVGLTLFLLTLAMNLIAQRLVKRFRTAYS